MVINSNHAGFGEEIDGGYPFTTRSTYLSCQESRLARFSSPANHDVKIYRAEIFSQSSPLLQQFISITGPAPAIADKEKFCTPLTAV